MTLLQRSAGPAPPVRRLADGRVARFVPLILILLAALVAGGLVQRSDHGRRQTIVDRFDSRHTTASRFIEAYVGQIVAERTDLARRELGGTVPTPARFGRMASVTGLAEAELYDSAGRLLRLWSPGLNPRRVRAAQVREALAGRPAIEARSDVVDYTPMLAFAVPYPTLDGLRVFAGRFPVRDTLLDAFVGDALPTFRTARVYLTTAAGRVVASSDRGFHGLPLARIDPALARQVRRPGHGFFDDGRRFAVDGDIEGTTWRLVFTLPTQELFESYTADQRYIPKAGLAALVAMGLWLLLMFRRVADDRARTEDARVRQEAILDATEDAFIGMDATGAVTDWNAAAVRMLGRSREEALGRPLVDLIVEAGERERRRGTFQGYLDGVDDGDSRTMTVQHRDGHLIPVEVAIARSQWRGGWRLHAFLRDVSERIEHERQLRELALTDPLTGLANRRAFVIQLDAAHARVRRHAGRLLVIYADVDRFKQINDRFGHAAGDSVLREVAARLRGRFRIQDTVGRLGGDEFAVVCEDHDDPAALLDQLREALSEPYGVGLADPIPVTVSLGWAVPREGQDARAVLESADESMYEAKAARPPVPAPS